MTLDSKPNDHTAKANALWYVGNGRAELREEEVAAPREGEVRVRALFGALSRGTERLVYFGRVPASEHQRMRSPHMGGAFPFPVKYGYAVVGRVDSSAGQLCDRIVFCLHPHQSVFTVPAAAVAPVPPDVPPARAVLAANMETALNAVWDGGPGPADRIAVVGGGLVGMLVAYLCVRLPGAEVTVVDLAASRAACARAIGARFASPENAPADCDLVFHASATSAGLATALRIAGEEAGIVELSWYGSGEVAAPLGEAFHARRLRLLSSQVGKVAPSRRPRWSAGRRLAAALSLLDDAVLDCLISSPIAFEELPVRLSAILAPQSDIICQLIRYPAAVEH
jgi:NADPH:quinone reductase-like Zn-dependent oxidoreductase